MPFQSSHLMPFVEDKMTPFVGAPGSDVISMYPYATTTGHLHGCHNGSNAAISILGRYILPWTHRARSEHNSMLQVT